MQSTPTKTAYERRRFSRKNQLKDTRRNGNQNYTVNLDECKQVIKSPQKLYCGVWKEEASTTICKSCPYFDKESLDYKLFRRI